MGARPHIDDPGGAGVREPRQQHVGEQEGAQVVDVPLAHRGSCGPVLAAHLAWRVAFRYNYFKPKTLPGYLPWGVGESHSFSPGE